MIPRKIRQHLDKHLKNRIVVKYDLQVNFYNFENRNVEHIYFIYEENWGKVYNLRHIEQES